jgi:acetate kinase
VTNRLILVVNPGSASRKYAVFCDGYNWADISFEFVNGRVRGRIQHYGQDFSRDYDDQSLGGVSEYVLPLLRERQVIGDQDQFAIVGVRVVAPGDSFLQDSLIDDAFVTALEQKSRLAPLHVTTVLSEITTLRRLFGQIPIVAVSDSAFHATKPDYAKYYGIDKDIADKLSVKRFGYHGISVSSIVHRLSEASELKKRAIVCHLGSGSSITAVFDGKSIDNTMGFSPLDGLMMATRSGSIDYSAALAVKREYDYSDEELEAYFNKQSGLLGVSGSSDDIRQLIERESSGDLRAKLALDIFVYRIQQAIGQMSASLGGVDQLIFTGTVGTRSFPLRRRILSQLHYLNFHIDIDANNQTYEPKQPTDIASYVSKPIIVIETDESAEIARHASLFL